MQLSKTKSHFIAGLCILVTSFSAEPLFADDATQELFETNCAACHGEDGRAVLPGTPHFADGERLNKTNGELVKSVTTGLNVMPPWEGILEKNEMNDLVNYARTLSSVAN